MKNYPTQEQLKRLFVYEPETGECTWLSRTAEMCEGKGQHKSWNTRFAGKPVKAPVNDKGYRELNYKMTVFKLHRLIYIYMTGENPAGIDHINHDRADNRWANLRAADQLANCRNAAMPKTNTSTFCGVVWDKRLQEWRAQIGVNYKNISLGRFDNFEDACVARKAGEEKYGFHPNHGSARA